MPTQEELNAAQVELDIANDNYAALADRYNKYQKLFQEYANASPEIQERAKEAMGYALEDFYQTQEKMRTAEDRIAVAQNTVNSYNELLAQQPVQRVTTRSNYNSGRSVPPIVVPTPEVVETPIVEEPITEQPVNTQAGFVQLGHTTDGRVISGNNNKIIYTYDGPIVNSNIDKKYNNAIIGYTDNGNPIRVQKEYNIKPVQPNHIPEAPNLNTRGNGSPTINTGGRAIVPLRTWGNGVSTLTGNRSNYNGPLRTWGNGTGTINTGQNSSIPLRTWGNGTGTLLG